MSLRSEVTRTERQGAVLGIAWQRARWAPGCRWVGHAAGRPMEGAMLRVWDGVGREKMLPEARDQVQAVNRRP